MELKDFIGKVVIGTKTGKRYVVDKITAPCFQIRDESPNRYGTYSCYCYETINEDPISSGALRFEDSSLTELYKQAYYAHCRSEDGRWENYGYWMRKD